VEGEGEGDDDDDDDDDDDHHDDNDYDHDHDDDDGDEGNVLIDGVKSEQVGGERESEAPGQGARGDVQPPVPRDQLQALLLRRSTRSNVIQVKYRSPVSILFGKEEDDR
jgi:hypothetical protein